MAKRVEHFDGAVRLLLRTLTWLFRTFDTGGVASILNGIGKIQLMSLNFCLYVIGLSTFPIL